MAPTPDRLDQPRRERYDALMRELVPKIRLLSPDLSDLEVLRAAARMAEYRLDDEETQLLGSSLRVR